VRVIINALTWSAGSEARKISYWVYEKKGGTPSGGGLSKNSMLREEGGKSGGEGDGLRSISPKKRGKERREKRKKGEEKA